MCVYPQEGGFTEYRIESKNDDNAIGLEVLLPNLMQALSSGTKAINVIIKLSKRGTSPFLTVISEVSAAAHPTAYERSSSLVCLISLLAGGGECGECDAGRAGACVERRAGCVHPGVAAPVARRE
jgi:hypothetical protein